MPFLIAEESGVEEGVVTEVLSKAQQVGFLDAGIFESYRVLTSRGIQKRFFLAAQSAKRKEIAVVENFLLINPADVPKNAVWYHAITMPKSQDFSLERISSGRNSISSGRNSINPGDNAQRERERERERETGSSTTIPQSVLDTYQTEIRPICNGIELEKLADDVERYGEAAVVKAIQRAAIRNKRSTSYVEAILRQWATNGYDDECRTVNSSSGAGRAAQSASSYDKTKPEGPDNRPPHIPPNWVWTGCGWEEPFIR